MAEVAEVKTIALRAGQENRPTHAIMAAINTDADGTPAPFVRELAETIALHRLCSPPDTSVLVVSVIGPFDSAAFQATWRATLSEPVPQMQALRFFVQEMTTAELAHGTREGLVLETVSLKLE
jgi:hypothetical protein